MTDTIDAAPRAKTGSLSAMRLADLQGLASGMGIAVSPKMRKADLVSAIRSAQGSKTAAARGASKQDASASKQEVASVNVDDGPNGAQQPTQPASESSDSQGTRSDNAGDGQRDGGSQGRQGDRGRDNRTQDSRGESNRGGQSRNQDNRGSDNQGGQNRNQDNRGSDNRGNDNRGNDNRGNDNRDGDNRGDDDGSRNGRRRNRQRGRDRKRGRSGQGGGGRDSYQDDSEGGYTEEDVLVPVAGIVDVLDSYAFIRTTGYLPGATDIYVPMGMVRRNGLRKGDAVAGAIKAPGNEHEQVQAGGKNNRGKFNALVRLDTVNGMTPDQAKARSEFGKLTPLYPQERLRLETDPKNLTTRIIDLVSPIGKGQRGLIVSPPKAGKTLVLQAIANAIT
ncbi:MAG: Rho termination factor N-terminal domain-containing protein, partial [Ornithinimicrobium sp.]